MVRKVVIALGPVVLVLFMSAGVAAHAGTSPEAAAAFVHGLGDSTIKVLRTDGASLSQREAEVRRIVQKNFALNQIGRFVLGRAWNKATDDQRREYLGLFSRYVLETYSRRLGGYSGETFSVVKTMPVGSRDVIVVTRIDRPSGPSLTAGWRVRDVKGRMLILDVIVEGISMVTAQRSEFASVVKSQGIDGLLQVLRLQISKFAAQKS